MLFFRKKRGAGTKAKKVVRAKKTKATKAQKRKKVVKKAPAASKGEEVLIGKVSHYFPHVKAGAILIKSGTIAISDTLHIKGHTTDFKQKVKSLQIERTPIEKGSKGDEVGILVKSRVRINDEVYKVKS